MYPFGHGLSYTKFSYGDVQLSKSVISPTDVINASITVTNSGNYDGEETVQLYIQDVVASVTQPVKRLKGFQKSILLKGESKTVSFTINIGDLKFYDQNMKLIAEPGVFRVYIGTSSNDLKMAQFTLTK